MIFVVIGVVAIGGFVLKVWHDTAAYEKAWRAEAEGFERECERRHR